MSLKSAIASNISAYFTGEPRLLARRRRAERRRVKQGDAHVVEYFHQVDDPYSHLTVQCLANLMDRYRIELRAYLVSAPEDWAAPERERLVTYSRTDAARLARRAGLAYTDPGQQPDADACSDAQARLAHALANGTFVEDAPAISSALWRGDTSVSSGSAGQADVRRILSAGDNRRSKVGHYLGATFHYAGEWYWGVDRLLHLEDRLADLGLRRNDAPPAPIYAQPATAGKDAGIQQQAAARELHFYLSFRSPYTYIVTERVKALADAYGCELKLRFVLPMVMRGLPVPSTKRLYIATDVAREARRLSVPFGRVADPVGRPVERGYSLLPWAVREGRGYEFALAFMRGAWAEGRDMGSNKGLRFAVENAGLSWQDAQPFLDTQDWRDEAEANRLEMMELGMWGVPCFRVGDTATWGQDRLWVIEEALRTAEPVHHTQ